MSLMLALTVAKEREKVSLPKFWRRLLSSTGASGPSSEYNTPEFLIAVLATELHCGLVKEH